MSPPGVCRPVAGPGTSPARRCARWRTVAALAGIPAMATSAAPAAVAAQEEGDIPGVALTLLYGDLYIPPLAILPFSTTGDSPEMGARIQAIMSRDLDFSDRFVIVDSLPAMWSDEGVQYGFWDQYGVDWVLTGEVERVAGARYLSVELHDIVTAGLRARGRFPLPPPDDDDFRMAVHRVSDEVVRWATGDSGMAATRILFSMMPFGDTIGKAVYVVDSDGQNRRRLTWDGSIAISPAWSPDGSRIMYTSYKSGFPRIYELNIEQGTERVIEPGRAGQHFMPVYHPDGAAMAFTIMGRNGGAGAIFSYNLRDNCCLRELAGGRIENVQPTYSHDGRYLAFVSNRLGSTTPHVYTMPSDGGTAVRLSPVTYRERRGGYFTDPDWSPVSGNVAFVGRIVGRGEFDRYNIFVADVEQGDKRVIQLTREGSSQDPSWAPDGRHIVYAGERSYGFGIFVVDTATGRTRILAPNVSAQDTDWSPSLGRAGAGRQAGGEAPRTGR